MGCRCNPHHPGREKFFLLLSVFIGESCKCTPGRGRSQFFKEIFGGRGRIQSGSGYCTFSVCIEGWRLKKVINFCWGKKCTLPLRGNPSYAIPAVAERFLMWLWPLPLDLAVLIFCSTCDMWLTWIACIEGWLVHVSSSSCKGTSGLLHIMGLNTMIFAVLEAWLTCICRPYTVL